MTISMASKKAISFVRGIYHRVHFWKALTPYIIRMIPGELCLDSANISVLRIILFSLTKGNSDDQ
jgi:hypothetical protein